MAKGYEGKIGTSYVERGDGSNPERGECEIKVDEGKSYATIKMEVQYDYGHFMFSNQIEYADEMRDSVIFVAAPHEDFNGELCGVWAPAKKVINRAIFKDGEVIFERTYRCPYFIFKSTDRWSCRY